MARPKNTKKDRLPIMEYEYNQIVFKTKHDKAMKSVTKRKLLRAYGLLYCFGARISEITNFTLDDLNFIYMHKYIILTDTKSNATQRLIINDKAIEILKSLDYSDCEDALFYRPNTTTPMNIGGLEKLINTHLKHQLNVLYTTHSFRAGYITRILEATGNPKIAQKLARHKDIITTLRYSGASDRQIDDALDKIF
ncbi:MAG: tyrosine-type recombinase/integrase [Arcobacteraceae bacterium]|nr:tyrosine-type recombinase/integrase [Arcobacteraceae bacterium]